MITVTHIAAPSEQGYDLFAKLKNPLEKAIRERCGEEVGWVCLNNLGSPEHLPPYLFLRQSMGYFCLHRSDLVIFDGSIDSPLCFKAVPEEPEGAGSLSSQYEYASSPFLSLEHVLVVSRTKLPYNFEGFRKGGSPNWIRTRNVSKSPFSKAKGYLTNDEIVAWILETIHSIKIPRPDKLETDPTSAEEMKALNSHLAELMNEAEAKFNEEYKDDIFISYRSKESIHAQTRQIPQKDGEEREEREDNSIEELLLTKAALKLKDELGDNGHFIYAPPGDISTEVMTAKRRWGLASTIHRQMEKCKGVLIYKKPDYDESWWTCAELMFLSYCMSSEKKVYPHLYVVEPIEDSFKLTKLTTPEEIRTFLPHMTEEQHGRLGRRLAYADPLEEASELEGKYISEQSELKKIIRALFTTVLICIGAVDKIYSGYSGLKGREDFEEMIADRKKRSFWEECRLTQKSLHSLVQTPEFDKGLLIDCPYCKAKHSYSKDADGFIDLKHTYRLDISVYEQLQKEKERVEVKLPCGHTVRLKRGEPYYHFIQPMVWKVLNKEKWVVKPIYAVEFDFDDDDNDYNDNIKIKNSDADEGA